MPSLQALRQVYQTQGYCVLPNRLDSHILESVSQEIIQWIENYPLESQHAVFEIRPQYQTHEDSQPREGQTGIG